MSPAQVEEIRSTQELQRSENKAIQNQNKEIDNQWDNDRIQQAKTLMLMERRNGLSFLIWNHGREYPQTIPKLFAYQIMSSRFKAKNDNAAISRRSWMRKTTNSPRSSASDSITWTRKFTPTGHRTRTLISSILLLDNCARLIYSVTRYNKYQYFYSSIFYFRSWTKVNYSLTQHFYENRARIAWSSAGQIQEPDLWLRFYYNFNIYFRERGVEKGPIWLVLKYYNEELFLFYFQKEKYKRSKLDKEENWSPRSKWKHLPIFAQENHEKEKVQMAKNSLIKGKKAKANKCFHNYDRV